MGTFGGWIIAIVGSICLTALIDILLQDGETKKYVKTILSLIVFSVILAPIPKLLNSENTQNTLNTNDAVLSYEDDLNLSYLYELEQRKCENLKNSCEKSLKNIGIENVTISAHISYEKDPKIVKIWVDLKNAVITNRNENIDITKETKYVICSVYGVDENCVEIIS